MWHILERGAIHFIAACALTLAAFFAYRFWLRMNGKVNRWISHEPCHLLVLSALTVWALSTLREPFDVAAGQSVVKALTDFFSWFAGCAVAAWGLYRLRGAK